MNQVVCIDDDWFNCGGKGTRQSGQTPILGQVYTIVGHKRGVSDGEKYYSLYEVPGDMWWYSGQFKPVKKTDISTFTGMLKTKTKEPEDA